MTRRALVTGVSGFAGRALARRLVADGWDVAGISLQRTAGIPGVQDHRVDLLDQGSLSSIAADFRPDTVFHLAAIVDTVSTPDVVALFRVNTLGTASVLNSLRGVESIGRVLVASSAFVYGSVDGRTRVPETAPCNPVTAYGASKLASEVIALEWGREHGVDLVVSRAFQHTGPGHTGAYALADWSRQLASGVRQLFVGNLEVQRDYLDVRDVASAYIALATSAGADSVYNVGSGIARSMQTMLDSLIEAFGADVEVIVAPDRFRPSDQPVFVADTTRLHAATDWRPRYSMEQTLEDLAQWSLENAEQSAHHRASRH